MLIYFQFFSWARSLPSLMPEAVLSPVRNESVNMGNILKPLLSKSAAAGKEVTEREGWLIKNLQNYIFPIIFFIFDLILILIWF